VPKTCVELLLFVILIWDQIRQAKADFQLVLLVPGLKHGSGTGDHWHGGKGGPCERSLTPLERFLNLSSPGRIGS